MRIPAYCICENNDEDHLQVTVKLISDFVLAIQKVQFLYFLITKFQASSNLVWL